MSIFKQKHIKGFSLVEMMVSLMIFSIVAVIALGAMTKIVSVNKKAQTLLSSVTNINFALDIMSREISLANSIYCTSIPANASPQQVSLASVTSSVSCNLNFAGGRGTSAIFAFKTTNPGPDCSSADTVATAYLFHVDPSNTAQFSLEKAQQTDCGQDFGSTDAPFVSVTSPNVTLQDFSINVNYGASQKTPLAFLHISGYAGVTTLEKTYFQVQTAISLPKLQ